MFMVSYFFYCISYLFLIIKVAIISSPFLMVLIYALIFSNSLFSSFTSLSSAINKIKSIFVSSLAVQYISGFLSLYFMMILLINFLGNIPFISVPSLLYSFSFSISFSIWLSLIISGFYSSPEGFISHLLPYGAPMALFFILPLIEVLSQILRPLTLCVRLSTNLAAGHIMLYIFSYFTILMPASGSIFVGGFLLILILVEGFISLLQAYIFITLISLYFLEVEEVL